MLNKILNIAKISQITQNNTIKTYNTTLPVLLQVFQKTQIGYLLKLGNNFIEAKSAKELQIGTKYWAIIDENKGEITLSKLLKQPELFEVAKHSTLKPEITHLSTIFKEKNIFKNTYESILETLLNTQNKDEFTFLSHTLLSFQKGILTLAIKDEKKEILLQIKKPQNNKIDFSAVFQNLGIIVGSLYTSNRVLLKVQYKNVKQVLIDNIDKLDDFEIIEIIVDENLDILFDLRRENILDLEV